MGDNVINPQSSYTGILRRSLILGGVAATGLATQAVAQPGMLILDPAQTVGLEHDDRVERIRRATRRLGVYPAPDFSSTLVRANQMPSVFRVDTPVLRVSFSERTFFDTAQSRILPTGQAVIAAIAEAVRGEAPDVAMFVAGHTDSRGSEAYNYELSVRRSESVANALLGAGIGNIVLWRVGFGEAVPLYPNDTDEHLAFNRRVEFLFAARTEAVLQVLTNQLVTPCVAATRAEAAACVGQAELRPDYEVVAVGPNRTTIGTDAPARRSAPPSPGRRGAPVTGPGRRSAGSSETRTARVDTPDRIQISLRERSYAIPAPLH